MPQAREAVLCELDQLLDCLRLESGKAQLQLLELEGLRQQVKDSNDLRAQMTVIQKANEQLVTSIAQMTRDHLDVETKYSLLFTQLEESLSKLRSDKEGLESNLRGVQDRLVQSEVAREAERREASASVESLRTQLDAATQQAQAAAAQASAAASRSAELVVSNQALQSRLDDLVLQVDLDAATLNELRAVNSSLTTSLAKSEARTQQAEEKLQLFVQRIQVMKAAKTQPQQAGQLAGNQQAGERKPGQRPAAAAAQSTSVARGPTSSAAAARAAGGSGPLVKVGTSATKQLPTAMWDWDAESDAGSSYSDSDPQEHRLQKGSSLRRQEPEAKRAKSRR